MREDFSWIYTTYDEYLKLKDQEPFFISDWDVDSDLTIYPNELLRESMKYFKEDSFKYLYSEDLPHIKELIVSYLNEKENSGLTREEICIALNSTNAIYLALYALIRKKLNRFMVCTPVYFSIVDTLKDFRTNLTFFHLKDGDNFSIDINDLSYQVDAQYIEALIITDPIYSSGVSLPLKDLKAISDLCEKKGVWLIIDYSLGGFSWKANNVFNVDPEKMNILNKVSNKLIVSSIAKNLFINGLKHSLIIGNKELITIIEDLTYTVSGGLYISQVNFIKSLYSISNFQFIEQIAKKNISTIKNNFAILNTSLIGSGWEVARSDSGYFTMVSHSEKHINNVDIKKFIRILLLEYNIRALPSNYFGYHSTNHFAFRVNLLKNLRSQLPVLVQYIEKYFE